MMIHGDSFEDYDFKKRIIGKSVDAKVVCLCAMKNNPMMFGHFEPDFLLQLVDAMFQVNCSKAHNIIKEGDLGDNWYVIEQGTLRVEKGGVVVATLQPDDSFGEIALFYNTRRQASVISNEACQLWALGRLAYRHLTAQQSERKIADAVHSLSSVPLLASLRPSQMVWIAGACSVKDHEEGDVIIHRGEEGNCFYMISEGVVEVRNIKKSPDLVVTLRPGDYFGESALLTNRPRNADVVAVSPRVSLFSYCLGRHSLPY